MNRYMVFMWRNYEASGGMGDFIDSFPTMGGAEEEINISVKRFGEYGDAVYWHVFDTVLGAIVVEGSDE